MRAKTEAARILGERKMNPEGRELDQQRLDRTNLIVVKAANDRYVAMAVGRKLGERSDFTREQLDQVDLKRGSHLDIVDETGLVKERLP